MTACTVHFSCWMKPVAVHYSVVLPIGLVLAANTVIFIIIIHGLMSAKRRAKKHHVHAVNRATARLHLQAAIAVFVILGEKTSKI